MIKAIINNLILWFEKIFVYGNRGLTEKGYDAALYHYDIILGREKRDESYEKAIQDTIDVGLCDTRKDAANVLFVFEWKLMNRKQKEAFLTYNDTDYKIVKTILNGEYMNAED